MSKSLKLFNVLFFFLLVLPAVIFNFLTGMDFWGGLIIFTLIGIYFSIIFFVWWLPKFIKFLRETPGSRDKSFRIFIAILTMVFLLWISRPLFYALVFWLMALF